MWKFCFHPYFKLDYLCAYKFLYNSQIIHIGCCLLKYKQIEVTREKPKTDMEGTALQTLTVNGKIKNRLKFF